MGKTVENLTPNSPSKQTVVLYGDVNDPQIQLSKKRIEFMGRAVEIQPRPAHDTGLGICGQHMCTCTEPCKSFHYNPEVK